MFKSKKQKVIFLAAFAAFALVTCLSLVFTLTRRPPGSPDPNPVTLTTTSGGGTSATYQVQERVSAPCPELDGAHFTAGFVQIRKGEATMLTWKVPFDYASTLQIEGLELLEPPSIGSFTAGPSNEPITPAIAPNFYENGVMVRPERTTTYKLKAEGPLGCQPLKWQLTVSVIG